MTRILFFFLFFTIHARVFGSIYFPSEKVRDSLLVVIKTAEKEGLADAYNQLAIYYNIVDPSKAGEYIDLALRLSRDLQYKGGISFALKEKGMNLLYAGDIVKALILVEEAKLISEEAGDYQLQGQSLHCEGLIYSEAGFYEIAIKYFNEAISAYTLAGSEYMVEYAYYDIAATFVKSRQYEKALQYTGECFALSKKINSNAEKGPVYLLLGKIYDGLDKDSLALANFQHALVLIEKEQLNEQVKGLSYLEIGNYHLRKNNFELANQYLQAAKVSVENGPNLILKGNVMSGLAEAYQLQGAHRQALSAIDSALRIGKETNAVNLLSKAYFAKARIIKSLGEEEAAFENLTHAYALTDSISSVGFRSLIADKITHFEAQKAEAKILDLNSELEIKKHELDDKKTQLNLYLFLGVLVVAIFILIAHNMLKMRKLSGKITTSNQHVRQQNIELIQLNEENNNFIKLVAHDLRSPVNNIVSVAALMKKENLSEEERTSYLSLIDTICMKLDKTIAKFLDSRLSLEKTRIILPERFEVNELLEQLVKEYGPKTVIKKIKLKYIEVDKNIHAHTDKAYISQITSNLLSNAVKFSPVNSTIMVLLRATAEEFFISIKDEGPGISKTEQLELFKMYSTTSNKPTGNEPSTGLGLAIAKKMAEGLGGTIILKSEEGKGSTFIARIPLECDSR